MVNEAHSTTASVLFVTRQASLADLSIILSSEPGEGSKDVLRGDARGEPRTIWKVHFDDLSHPGIFTQQLESACAWLESHLNEANGKLPTDCKIYARVGLCFTTVTGSVTIPADLLRRLSSYVSEVEITYYPTCAD